MIFGVLWLIIVPVVLWFFIIRYLIFDEDHCRISPLVIFCLAIGIGFGVSSILYFLWFAVVGPTTKGFFIVELILPVSLLIICYLRKGFPGKIFVGKDESKEAAGKRLPQVVSFCFIGALIADLYGFLYRSLANPHGSWDAWAIWNLHARFLFRAGKHWTILFSPGNGHADYPLLTPAFIARCWKFIGNDTTIIPILLAMIFTFATVGLATGCISDLRNKYQGYLAGLVLLGTIPFFKLGVSQYADMPLAFYFLATLVIFTLKDAWRINNPNWLILAGITSGLAAWTKNEGLLAVVIIIITRIIVVVNNKGWKAYFKELLYFAMGLIPILVILLYFKLHFASPNDMIVGQSLHRTLGRISTFPRYIFVAKSFLKEIILLGNKNVGFPMVVLLMVYLFVMGLDKELKYRRQIATSLIFVGLMLLCYFMVYIVTPHNLVWQVSTSMNRLILQLYPSILISYFLIVRSMQEAWLPK